MAGATPTCTDQVLDHARRDMLLLKEGMTVGQVLETIRKNADSSSIVYFYVVDAEDRLVGVIPTRRLITADLEKPVSEVMYHSAIAIPHDATVHEAVEYFVRHRFLALPIIDDAGKVVGVVDVSQFTDEVFEVARRDQADAVFEALGFHLSSVKDASALTAFRFRFPWLLCTVGSGTICALLAGVYETTLQANLVIAFFVALVLGLGESVAMQSMTVAIQVLQAVTPTWRWYFGRLLREGATAALLGLGCGATVAVIVLVWRQDVMAASVIGGSIGISLVLASVAGLTVPCMLHALKLDPKIAAGPMALALADFSTTLVYYSIAASVLGP
ncbi:CBS domain containing protein [Pirellula staleyi DSM 6068]|uniref:CBS domain containing protein n=1 Tax=Pirellula staleyi (strain ATCC 27377 / DSM 6068 / ICPB 4128) TaxID=530564 RepID=D2QYZ6_PIRSD|nr:magnesium transporter [Pirellula staleyi]ADB16451.1 CBS domain containing protein [Pirellula staleyi DSM 6068]